MCNVLSGKQIMTYWLSNIEYLSGGYLLKLQNKYLLTQSNQCDVKLAYKL